jgi:hypothetical protein
LTVEETVEISAPVFRNRCEALEATRDVKVGGNGPKIRSREKRGMGLNPIIGTFEKQFYQGKLIKTAG